MSESISFAAQENLISEYWDQIDAFQESVRRSVGKPEYSFYDGPPFATGLPHYGHILAGTIKVLFIIQKNSIMNIVLFLKSVFFFFSFKF